MSNVVVSRTRQTAGSHKHGLVGKDVPDRDMHINRPIVLVEARFCQQRVNLEHEWFNKLRC